MKYEVGDKVLMNPKSTYASQAKRSVYGIVVAVNPTVYYRLPYQVSWKSSNGIETHKNSYGENDLLPFPSIELKPGDCLISSEGMFLVIEVSKDEIMIQTKTYISQISRKDLNVKYFQVEL